MDARDLLGRLRHFDAYPKTLEDFRVKTYSGAVVTIVSGVLMLVLFLSELNYYLTKEVQPELFVDTSRGQKIKINIDMVFPRMPCGYLSLDAMDVSGEQQIDVDHNLFKKRLDLDGKPIDDKLHKEALGDKSKDFVDAVKKKELDPDRCESCYGAETQDRKCCNTCEEVREAYRKKGWAFNNPEGIEQCDREGWTDKMMSQKNEGCQVLGYLQVNKVAGNFHFAPGKSFQQHHVHVHDLQAFGGQKFNITHTVNHLSFGKDYPGIVNPLDGLTVKADEVQMMYQYFVKVVPTTYVKTTGQNFRHPKVAGSAQDLYGKYGLPSASGFFSLHNLFQTLYTNQFSVTKHAKVVSHSSGETGLPGVFFMYELSPMMVKYTEKQRSFMHFLTGVCAIVGGIFTVAGLVDSMVYHSAKAIQQKIDLGKAS